MTWRLRGFRILLTLAGVGMGRATSALAQCGNQAAVPGRVIAPTPVVLGVQVSGTPTTTLVKWNGLTGACAYTVRWWVQNQPATSGGQSPSLLPAVTTWTGTPTLPPGTYIFRVTANFWTGAFGYDDRAFQVPLQVELR